MDDSNHQPQTRGVTAAEREHYRRNGWVKLERLIAPDYAGMLLERFLERTKAGSREGDEGDADGLEAIFVAYDFASRDDDVLREFAHSSALGKAASELMTARDRLGGLSGRVRCAQDQYLCKPPSTAGSKRTPWHQDLNLLPFDRAGGMVIWIALADIPPEKGSMRFLSGSHQNPPLGRVFGRKDGKDLVDMYPRLTERYEVSPPLTMRPGDATVHDYCTVHSAFQNTTDEIRWSYLVEFIPAEATYTGQPHRTTDGLGLEIDRLPEHERFPLIED